MNHFSYDQLYRFSKDIFIAMGCPESDAETATKTLLSADMRGVDSHGVARLSGYVRLWDKQRINAKPDIKVIHETPSTATIDGDAGLGLVVAPFAMQVAIEKAKNAGTGWVAVKNSNHYGIAGYHAMKALGHDMIGMSMTNASPLVSPTFSKERMLGTNPIAVAIPANEQPPFVGDFATTPAANGKLEVLMRKGENAPLGWIQDQGGQSTDNAHGIKEGGSWLPLGGDREHGSHKGFILGSIVDIFSAVLSGANYGPWAPPFVAFLEPSKYPVGEGLGHFFGAMRVDAFRPAEDFKSHMDNWITRFRESDRADENQPVVIPGDPERAYEKERSENGIPLLEPVEKDLRALGERFGVKF
ncbi:MAG: Ldh family oxidoreductase [Roseivirga sp.]|jgi:LDH2 family malate/lactate/ureidoglycolate dehydrogenase|uniref:Ldh family oxidoreductase n=1 Tax=Roseivirga sp. TaxID=1964215 RepID=UPI001B1BE6F3|nr:Ldh family oxidoreductase [Roseivirga sp.]MBO6494917.1 Ldh family oxidoreductase [Roseivirga sp.]